MPTPLPAFVVFKPVNYHKLDSDLRRHHERYKCFVEKHGMLCQECGASGKYVEDRVDHIEIPGSCGFCEGTGKITPHMRGLWLRWKREEKQELKRAL